MTELISIHVKNTFMKRFLPFFLLLLAACEKEVSLDIPAQQPLLTLHSLCTTGDTIRIAVGRSRAITETRTDAQKSIGDAIVIVTEDSSPADTAIFDAARQRYISHTVARPGRQYRILVKRADFPDATAEATAPAVVPIAALEYRPLARPSSDGGMQDEIRVRWSDPASAGDIYMLDILGYRPDYSQPFDTTTGPTVFIYGSLDACVQVTDAEVESVDGVDPGSLGVGAGCAALDYLFVRDAAFNGGEKEVRFFIPSGQLPIGGMGGPADTGAITLRLKNVTPEGLRYLQSRATFYNTDGNPFAEPVNVTSTVQGGYGFFAIEGVDEREVMP